MICHKCFFLARLLTFKLCCLSFAPLHSKHSFVFAPLALLAFMLRFTVIAGETILRCFVNASFLFNFSNVSVHFIKNYFWLWSGHIWRMSITQSSLQLNELTVVTSLIIINYLFDIVYLLLFQLFVALIAWIVLKCRSTTNEQAKQTNKRTNLFVLLLNSMTRKITRLTVFVCIESIAKRRKRC